MKLLGRRASQKPYKVAIVGRTGSGKSTLLNALLQCSLLPTSGKGAACTSVVTEISYSDGPDITAKISYKSLAQWKTELNHLIDDALEANVDSEESAETSHLSPAFQAREKLYQIYPHLRDLNVATWDADSLLADPSVSDYLGQEPTISASNHENFGKKLEQCLSSCGDHRSIWPLVERVHIRGVFPVLSTGITLVDLPGHGDVDNSRASIRSILTARDNSANEYMRDADTVFVGVFLPVTPIARAIDDRDTHKHLEKQTGDYPKEPTYQTKITGPGYVWGLATGLTKCLFADVWFLC
ncbi:P-loop containing nucleoside triphosphate hydrolase protein [Mycena sp. CBHHK59/15]|nr:P-loop containing nucleoside triphosphate hydrolase protein [Mycena sp. CBHHK59/15]